MSESYIFNHKMAQNAEQIEAAGANAVGIKLPPFWPEDPVIWFAQAEAQFTLRGITADQTKYSHIITTLDQNSARRVRATLANPPEGDNKYKTIKDELCGVFELKESERANKLLAIKSLGDRRPSELMSEIQALAGDKGINYLEKQIFINALPKAIQLQLNNEDFTDPMKAARTADELWSNMLHHDSQLGAVSAVATKPVDNPDWCFYHKKFGKKANKCKAPCTHPSAGNAPASRN